jgi:hypothetical protein
MFRKDFDPLEQLEQQQAITQKLTDAHAQNCILLKQIVEHVNILTEARNNHDLQINEMHNRLRLLEVARQYENQDHNTDSQA